MTNEIREEIAMVELFHKTDNTPLGSLSDRDFVEIRYRVKS
jgi:hypothetical protein